MRMALELALHNPVCADTEHRSRGNVVATASQSPTGTRVLRASSWSTFFTLPAPPCSETLFRIANLSESKVSSLVIHCRITLPDPKECCQLASSPGGHGWDVTRSELCLPQAGIGCPEYHSPSTQHLKGKPIKKVTQRISRHGMPHHLVF